MVCKGGAFDEYARRFGGGIAELGGLNTREEVQVVESIRIPRPSHALQFLSHTTLSTCNSQFVIQKFTPRYQAAFNYFSPSRSVCRVLAPEQRLPATRTPATVTNQKPHDGWQGKESGASHTQRAQKRDGSKDTVSQHWCR